MKTLMFRVSKMVIDGNDFHTKLIRNEKAPIEVISGTQVYCKILLNNYPPPVKLVFDYTPPYGKKIYDLSVFVSLKGNVKPSSTNYEKKFKKPKTVVIESYDTSKISYIYVGLESVIGCLMSIKTVFPL
jgi:hypothetical protein